MTNNTKSTFSPVPHRDGLEARFGVRVASMLAERAQSTAARHQRAPALRPRAGAGARPGRAPPGADGRRPGGGRPRPHAPCWPIRSGWWFKLGSAAPLALLVLGLAGIAHVHDKAQIAAVAEVDAALLSDDLPPAAYTDPGFAEYLKTNRE